MKKNEVRVTPFTLADEVYFQEAAGLLETNFPEAYDGEGLLELEKCLSKNRVAFKAMKGNEFFGFVSSLEAYGPYGWELHPLVVKKEARNRGIGRALVEALEETLQERGVLTLFLGTDDERYQTSLSQGDLFENLYEKMATIKNFGGHPFGFYEKLGYQLVGVLPDVNGVHKPDLLMAKSLRKKEEVKDV